MATKRHQALLIGNAALVLLVGLFSGFGLLFNLLGEITLWPIPGSLDVQLPGEPARWVAAHIGNIMNAIMAIAIALCLPFLQFAPRAEKLMTWGLIITIWGNAGFYLMSALGASGRGLSFGENRFGGGDLLSQLTFLVAYPAAVIVVVVMIMIAHRAFGVARE